MNEDASAGGASEKKIVSEYKHWITEDVSAKGASENFLTRIKEAIKKIVRVKFFSLIYTGPSGQKPRKKITSKS